MQLTDLSSRVIPATEYRRERWRNQLGWTREILRLGDADAWSLRLSIAEIEQDAVFSAFPGIDRELVLLHGNGMRLQFGNAASGMGSDTSTGTDTNTGTRTRTRTSAGIGIGIGTATSGGVSKSDSGNGNGNGNGNKASGAGRATMPPAPVPTFLAAVIAAASCCRRTSASDLQARKRYMPRCSTGRPRIST